MSGLIWAGLGKGIADAGSAIGNSWFKAIEEDVREQRLMEREERRALLKEEADARKEERLAQERAEIATRISKRADDISTQRTETSLDRDAGKLAKSSEQAGADGDIALSEEQLRNLVKTDPKLRESWRKSGEIDGNVADRIDPRLRRANDEEQAARDVGAKATVIEAYAKAKKDTLAQIAQEKRDEAVDRRFDLAEQGQALRSREVEARIASLGRRDTVAERNADTAARRADIAAARPAGGGRSGGGSDAPKVRSTYTNDTGNRVAVMSDGTERTLGKAADWNKSVASAIAKREKDDYQFSKLPEEQKKAWAVERLASSPSSASDQAPPAPKASAPAGGGLPAPKSKAELDRLPSGTRYTAPDGTTRIKQ